MLIQPVTAADLSEIKSLQPADWPDILPYFDFYTKSDFCFPIRYLLEGQIAGIGCSIVYGETAWLAHIIVHPEFRNRGIGATITEALVNSLKNTHCKTILLIATKLGQPVYSKIGFEKDTEYVYLREGKTSEPVSGRIIPYHDRYLQELLTMDRSVSGEERFRLLSPHLNDAHLFIGKEKLLGYYIPTLGEGLIIAGTTESGLELLKLKHMLSARAALPVENEQAVNFLQNHGFREVARGTRMVLGKKISWKPDCLYSRIGGNLG